MPFYEYECQACGAQHEAMQKMSDAPLKSCPECGKAALVRLISAPVFRLKGGGWYETDFKSDKEKKRNLAGGEDKPSSDGDSAAARRKAPKKAAPGLGKPDRAKPALAKGKKKAAKGRAKPKAKSPAKPKAGAKAKAKASAKRPRSSTKSKAAAKKAPARKTRR